MDFDRSWPAAEVVIRRLADLKPDPENARTHSQEQVAQIAGMMRSHGWTIPMLVDENDIIIAGHGRWQAARELGITEASVITARGWTAEQKRAYQITDNQIALNSAWDPSKLASQLGDLKGFGVDLAQLGFSQKDLASLFRTSKGLTDPDEVPPVPTDPISRPGDRWTLGSHLLLCGDATNASDVARALDGAKPHLMVTDPPYGVEYDPQWRPSVKKLRADGCKFSTGKHAVGAVNNDARADWREAWALFPGDVAYVWHAGRHASAVQSSLESCELLVRSQIIWNKSVMIVGRGDYHWKHEPCWYAVRRGKTGHWQGDRKQTTVWDIAVMHRIQGDADDGKTSHSTQKPIECMRRPIENNSAAGDHVYEPFSGSGTTIIAGEMTGRAVHAIEINPAYVDVAVHRWEKFTGRKAEVHRPDEKGPAEAGPPLVSVASG